ncbi:MAG: HzsA-related protein [Pirellulaceae bacterium]
MRSHGTLSCTCSRVPAALFLLVLVFISSGRAGDDNLPENLAPHARVTASSQFSDSYRPQMATGGVLPTDFQPDGSDWAVLDSQEGWFELQWDQPVEAAQIIYCARTTSPLLECFKDYAVYLNGEPKPAVEGTLEHRRGPQKIALPQQRVTRIRIEFLSSHPQAINPGAAEIAVYAVPVTDAELATMAIPPEEKTPSARALRDRLIEGHFGFRDILLVKRKPLDISHVYVYHVEGYRPGGGLYLLTPDKSGGQLKCIFDAAEGMITTADLSYDGREIVFAMRRGGHVASNPVAHIEDISRYSDEASNYQLFRINIDGTELKQLTHGSNNNLDPCWLPDGGIAFMSDRKPAYAYCWVTTSPVLYRMERDGSKQTRLSANYLMDFTPSVLTSGRIIFTRWEYVDRPACPIQSLWTINPDGTGLAGFYGNRVLSPGTFMDAQPIPNTHSVIATATNHNGPCRGGIVAIDPTRGANARESVRNLTPEIDIYAHRVGGGPYGNGMLDCGIHGTYEKPLALDEHHYLVSKGGVVQIRDFDGNAASLLGLQDGLGFYSPQPVRGQSPPPVVSGNFMDGDTELPEDGSVSGNWATVILQDVYHGLGPDVKRGEIKQIAVVQEVEKSTHSPFTNKRPDGPETRVVPVFGFQFPLVSCGATYAPKKVWGLADVGEDGSAAFQVPSEVPIYFLALDGEGRAVQRMRTFTHFMPGEVQGCVGCHADRSSVAPRVESRLPTHVTPQELIPPAWGVKGFNYVEVVQGVFDRHCIECHNEHEQPAGVDLTGDMTDFFNVSYDVLCRTGTQGEKNWMLHGSPSGAEYDAERGMSPYVEWIWTINGAESNILEIAPRRWGSPASKLAEILRSGHPDQEGKPQIDVPDEERRRVYLWMDLNIPYYGTSSSNHTAQLGSRQMMPLDLDSTLGEVASRRCAECHPTGVPRKFYTRVMSPEKNSFLLAPLAKSAGGSEKCGQPVFLSTADPDYQKILQTFAPIEALLREQPREDCASVLDVQNLHPAATLVDHDLP